MKPSQRLFVISALAPLGLAACAGVDPLKTAGVDPRSPVAADVARLAAEPGPFPEFKDIPPAPTDIRKPKAWGVAAGGVELAAARLERETAPGTWTLSNSDTWAAQAIRQAGAPPPVAGASTSAASEAYARELRRRATPPPPPRR